MKSLRREIELLIESCSARDKEWVDPISTFFIDELERILKETKDEIVTKRD